MTPSDPGQSRTQKYLLYRMTDIYLSPGGRLAASAVLGACLTVCFAPVSLPIAPLIVFILLLVLEGATVRQAAMSGLTFGMFFFGISLRWLGSMFGAAAFTLWVLSALFPMFAFCLYVWLPYRLPRFPGWLLFPIVWSGTEYFRSELMMPDFTWMGLGYSAVNSPLLVWPARFVGCYGVTFFICLLGSLVYWIYEKWIEDFSNDITLPSIVFAVLGGLVIYWRPGMPAREPGVSIRLVQAGSEQEEDLFGLSLQKTGFKADLIVWPEDSFVSDPHTTPKLWPKLAALPKVTGSWFLFGARDEATNGEVNGFHKAAYLLDPHGDLAGKHFKNHLVHFFREGIAGTEAHAVDTSFGKIGIGVCFDMDYPDVARREVGEGARLLVAPSDNPAEWGPLQHLQHRQLFQMRAIECGRWIAVADTAGDTFVAAPNGKIVNSVNSEGAAKLDVVVPQREGRNLFVMLGWRFGQSTLAALTVLWLLALQYRPIRETDHQSDDNPRAA